MKQYAKLALSLLGILCPTAMAAQNDYAAEKALITKVKRAPATYVFAEATSRTEDEARDIAEEMFLENINEYVASQKKLRGANNIVVNNQKGMQQTVTMPRGSNMHRVFMYVKKSDIIPADNSVVLARNADDAQDDAATKNIAATVEQETKTEQSKKTESAAKAETDANNTVVNSNTGTVSDIEQLMPQNTSSMPETAQQLAAFTNVKTLAAWLKDMKAKGTVTDYNKYNATADKEACWLVIYDAKGDIAAVLTDGKQRRNAATQKPDHERNYPNCAAICVRLAQSGK